MKCHPNILMAYCDLYAGVAVVVIGPDGCIRSASAAFNRLLLGDSAEAAAVDGLPLDRWFVFDSKQQITRFQPCDSIETAHFSATARFSGPVTAFSGLAIRLLDEQALFFQQDLQLDVDVLARITELNFEIADMARDLTRKNAELRSANKLIQELMETDPLTGAYNRRYLMEQLASFASYARRSEIFSFSIVMLDIDHFKSINDTHGHAAGDDVLVALTRLIKNNIRQEDVLVRFGGEEFLILLPGQSGQQAYAAAEKLRSQIEAAVMPHAKQMTVSCGVTTWRPSDSMETLLKRADDAMYAAKAAGRNVVVHQQA